MSNPFLFCAYHKDAYPQGNAEYGPVQSLQGRQLGQDFELKDGYRMYHGHRVPGFPVHPHRGFETITLVRQGFVDHADSLGAAGRYGAGDVQWMTAGRGLQHSEMFPLLDQNSENPLELLQIWINLPKSNKMAEPGYKMFWHEEIPHLELEDGQVRVEVIAGKFDETEAPAPPKDSWANNPENEVALWLIRMQPRSRLTLPTTQNEVPRSLYFYQGTRLTVDELDLSAMQGTQLSSNHSFTLQNGEDESHLLVMQGKPIAEPVAQYGPFVMNAPGEIKQAMIDYEDTQFGGWSWPKPDMVHGPEKVRFARQPDGSEERPKSRS